MTAATVPRRNYRGATAEQRRARRRAQLVDAGLVVFGRDGFHAATVRGVCAEAGLTERYFYESFDNLLRLFGAVYDRSLERLRTRLVQTLDAGGPDPLALAGAGLESFFCHLRQHPAEARVLLIEVYGTTDDFDRLYRRGIADFAALIRDVLVAYLEPGQKPALEPDLLSTALAGAATHLATRWYLGGYSEPEAVMVAHMSGIVGAVFERVRSDSSSK